VRTEAVTLAELLLEDLPCLFEANTGVRGRTLEQRLTAAVSSSWEAALRRAGNVTFSTSRPTLLVLADGTVYDFHHNEIKGSLLIAFKFYKPEPNGPILGAHTSHNAGGVFLEVDIDSNGEACLAEIDMIRNLAAHEAKHLADYFQKYPMGVPGKTEYAYLSSSGETVAYTSTVIGELEMAVKKQPDITFAQALQQSPTWRRYERAVFKRFPRRRSHMLSKLAHWWNHYKP
jgi:hypothetical protein